MIARWFGLAVGFLGLSVIIGCADDGLGTRYAVTGTVKLEGAPVAKGVINFLPDPPDKGRGASGNIKDGAYTLMTNDPDDGAFAGKYKVTIADLEVNPDAAREAMLKEASKFKGNKAASIQMNPMTVDEAMLGKMSRKAKNSVPERYGKVGTTPLTAEVKEQSNTINFDLGK